MKQILQDLKNGGTDVVDVPAPAARPGHVVVRTAVSLISAGTERMLVEFGRSNLLDKARQQPDKVRMVLDKVKTDGLVPTVQAVQSKLDQPLPLGYSNVGVVVEVGDGIADLEVGDLVVSNGPHAEVVCVPRNLCARVPTGVAPETASFTVLAAIALQGIRLAAPTLGENVVVTGLGLIGLVAVQILRAAGCNVLGIDTDASRVALARRLGAHTVDLAAGEDPLEAAAAFAHGRGVDAVLLTVSTKSDEPLHQAAQMCRQRGRIVLVGVTGLKLARADFYEKELTFQVSCSYGPGRYDPRYEEQGQDYPYGFVRWTEQRNFEAVLRLMADGKLQTDDLVSHRFSIADASAAYDVLANEAPLGIVIQYADDLNSLRRPLEPADRKIALAGAGRRSAGATVGMIGAGNYASQVLIPGLRAAGATLGLLASAGGVSSVHAGNKFGFASATTDPDRVATDPDVDTVVIATRHDTHAQYALAALRAGKHVFVEKPLALSREQLEELRSAYAAAGETGGKPLLMVGFNRRFSPLVVKLKRLLDARAEPKSFVMTVNAGSVPDDHWVQDPVQGGGRIVGEACHFIDLLRFLAAAPITKLQGMRMGIAPGVAIRDDKAVLSLLFADGSMGTIHYLANGHRSFPKERLEVFCGGSVIQLDNFRSMVGFGWPGFSKVRLSRQDKGNEQCIAAFVSAVKSGLDAPIPAEEIFEVSAATLDAVDCLAG
ncbi:MAG: bi-domain-containing oxidoreductase [Gammaproteobacteria bacterium]|jgi:predicted dehydrogenase/threonine dehydrogenase-like Zn-dependent dehydrogenase|nr:bi-domain-containing oxidoreductase [Gammaproteobacteria bacterium]